jgi:uncharacterized membrane protein (DUF4010 family)
MDTLDVFYRFGAALIIGVLIGLQREHAFEEKAKYLFAGARTFPLLSLVGALAALIADMYQSFWPFLLITLLTGGFILAAYWLSGRKGGLGMTTEVASLITVYLGALCYWQYYALAAALAVMTTLLLSLKTELRGLARTITGEDIFATLKFAVITAVILPVLPNTPLAPPPFDVVTPYKVWLMVVFISGISFLGYVLIKIAGTRLGIGLTGVLGGLASSTAVTMSFTQRSRSQPELSRTFVFAIITAWTIMYSRVFIIVAVLHPGLLRWMWLPLTASALAGLGYAAYLYVSQLAQTAGDVRFENPFEMGPAIKFGALYAIVLVISNTARLSFGSAGVYISSIFAGLTDVNVIALSMAELSGMGDLDILTASRAIVYATLANTVSKGGIALVGGSSSFRKALLPGFILMLAAGLVVMFLT